MILAAGKATMEQPTNITTRDLPIIEPRRFDPGTTAKASPTTGQCIVAWAAWSVIAALVLLVVVKVFTGWLDELDSDDDAGLKQVMQTQLRLQVQMNLMMEYVAGQDQMTMHGQGNLSPFAPPLTSEGVYIIAVAEVEGLDSGRVELQDANWRQQHDLTEISQKELNLLERTFTLIENDAAIPKDLQTDLQDEFGWFGKLLISQSSQSGQDARDTLYLAAMLKFVVLFALGMTILLGFVAGLVLLIIFIIRFSMRKIKLHPRQQQASYQTLGLEAFAGFMLLFIGFSVLQDWLVGQGWLSDIGSMPLAWLCLLAAGWPLLRGMSWQEMKKQLGFQREEKIISNLFVSLGYYLAMLPILAAVAVVCVMIFTWITFLLTQGQGGGGPAHPMLESFDSDSTFNLLIFFSMLCLWAPIVEEIFFRGFLLSHLRQRSRFLASGVLTALIFAVIHPQGLFFVPVLMVIGFTLAFIREQRGSLYPAIAIHSLHNGMIFLCFWVGLI